MTKKILDDSYYQIPAKEKSAYTHADIENGRQTQNKIHVSWLFFVYQKFVGFCLFFIYIYICLQYSSLSAPKQEEIILENISKLAGLLWDLSINLLQFVIAKQNYISEMLFVHPQGGQEGFVERTETTWGTESHCLHFARGSSALKAYTADH